MKTIKLTQGKFAIVDDKDYPELIKHKWHYCEKGGATRKLKRAGDKRPFELMHRFIMGLSSSNFVVDHINGNNLDNRRDNLRICTQKDNCKNRKKGRGFSCEYLGVSWEKRSCKWQVRIRHDGKQKFIGIYADVNKAAAAYNSAAIKYHGEFARLNQIKEPKP